MDTKNYYIWKYTMDSVTYRSEEAERLSKYNLKGIKFFIRYRALFEVEIFTTINNK